MKKLFGVFTVGLLCAVSSFPLYAGKLDPNVIFEDQERGRATLPQQTTKAATLHKEGLEGQGLKAAIIDEQFSTDFIENSKDYVDPVALSEGFIYDPAEKLEQVNVIHQRYLINALRRLSCKTDEEKLEIEKKIENIQNTINKKLRYTNLFNETKLSFLHGTMVAEVFRLIAPKAQFLPIESSPYGPNKNLDMLSPASQAAYGIRKAVQHGAHVINISFTIEENNDEIVKACQEAHQAGIPIIIGAGNDSKKDFPIFIDEEIDPIDGTIIGTGWMYVWNKLKGKGIYFAGALKYKKSGEETLTSYTQHSLKETEKHFICAPGEKISVVFSPGWGCGTSSAAPIISGGFLVLKQFVLENKYPLSAEEILGIMKTSGRDVPHSFKNSVRIDRQIPDEIVHKALDLENTKKTIEAMFKKNVINQAPQIVVGPRRALPAIPSQAAAPVVQTPPLAAQSVAPVAAVKVTPKPITPVKKYPPVNTGRTLK